MTKYQEMMQDLRKNANELFEGFTASERKLYGKAANSTNPTFYLDAATDALEVSGVEVSDAFMKLVNHMIEHWSFLDDEE